MPTKNTAISKSQLKNIIKITIGDRKKKRKRRMNRRKRQQTDQMDLIAALAAKPSMRAIQQDNKDAGLQNQLVSNSILSTKAEILRAVNDLGKPSFSTGYGPLNPFNTEEEKKEEDDETQLFTAKEPPAPTSAKKRPFFSLSPLSLSPLRTPTAPRSIQWGAVADAEDTPATASDWRIQQIKDYLIAHRESIPRKKTYSIEDIDNLKNENHIKELYRDTQKAMQGK